MPETPGAYLQKYKGISFQGVMGHESIHITKYRSSMKNDDSTGDVREKSYWDLRNFIKKRGDNYGSGKNGAIHAFTDSGHFYSDLLAPMPYVHVDLDILRAMFTGVGRPQDFKPLLRVIDVYLTRAEISEKRFKELGWTKFGWDMVPFSVQEYANQLLGVDCRGFVGAYLRDNYPKIRDTKNDMSFSIDSYNKGNASYQNYDKKKPWGKAFRRVDDPAEVRPGDLLVKCNNGDKKRHVSVIHSVGLADSMGVQATTAESRGGKGLCQLTDRLRRLKKKHQSGKNDRNWEHHGCHYNFVLSPR
ncbi:MAG: hypothetical protein AAGJ28_17515 [Pseudomonadota bacterium]